MKKILFGLALISLLPACKKDNSSGIAAPKKSHAAVGIKVENGRLNFTSVASYEKFLSAPDKESLINELPGKENFISYKNRRSIPQAAQARIIGNCDVPEDLIENNPVFFDLIINAAGIVEIAGNLYRYDYCNEKVWVISVANATVDTYYADFLAGVERRNIVGWFYTYVDAIQAVTEGYRTQPDPGTVDNNEIFQRAGVLGLTNQENCYINNDAKNPKGANNVKMDGKLSYDKFAVYFHFYGKEKYQTRCIINWCTASDGLRDWYVFYWYQCKRKGSSNWLTGQGNLVTPLAGENKVEKTFYDGFRGLNWGDAVWKVEKMYTNRLSIERNYGPTRWVQVTSQSYTNFSYKNNYGFTSPVNQFEIHF